MTISSKIPDTIGVFNVPGDQISIASFHGVVIIATTEGVFIWDGITTQKIEPFQPEQPK